MAALVKKYAVLCSYYTGNRLHGQDFFKIGCSFVGRR